MPEEIERFVEAIRSGRMGQIARIAQELGISESRAQELGDEAERIGACRWANENRRLIMRIDGAGDSTVPVDDVNRVRTEEPRELSLVSALARKVWGTLPESGDWAKNSAISSRPEFAEFDPSVLKQARAELRQKNLIDSRAGRDGGAIRRTLEEPAATPQDPRSLLRARLERELYEPFREYLVQDIDEETYAFAEVAIVADVRRRGRWTNPDVCRLTVTNFDYIPSATVELASFEMKRSDQVDKLESVYEAAAHGRWAHSTNLVLEMKDEAAVASEVMRDAERFGLGLWKVWFVDSGKLSVRQLLESAPRSQPDNADLNEMISTVLEELDRGRRGQRATTQDFLRSLR